MRACVILFEVISLEKFSILLFHIMMENVAHLNLYSNKEGIAEGFSECFNIKNQRMTTLMCPN